MDRLSSLDTAFLDIERSGPSVAVGTVLLLQGKAPTLEQLREFIGERLPTMPRFRQRVVNSRTKVRQAKWVSAEPDLEKHVTEVTIGKQETLDDVISRLMEQPMSRRRPLWDCTLIHGTGAGTWGCVFRIHHTVADGQGAVILLGRTIDLSPQGGFTLADAVISMSSHDDDSAVEDNPDGLADKAMRAVEAGFAGVGQFIATYPDTMRTLVQMTPKRGTDLTGPVSAKRRWVSASYPLDGLKQARRLVKGATLNDVVLAGVAQGFRALLEERGQDPSNRTVRAVMPVSLRTDAEANNQVAILPAPLPVGQEDPAKLIAAIRTSTKSSKRSMLPLLIDASRKAGQAVTPAPVQQFVLRHTGQTTEYFSETLVTNVMGPRTPMYFMGHLVLHNRPIIPIEGGMRIIVGITSYQDEFNIGITGDGEHAADVDVLLAGILAGFDDIVAAAGGLAQP